MLTGPHRKSPQHLLNRRYSATPDGVDAVEEKGELKTNPRRR
jgi:hypothetical protein